EKEFIRKDGGRVWALVGGAAFEETRNQTVAFVVDLSDRRRAEEALQKAQAELAHVTRMTTLGELAASIAHEVNQPLGAIVADAAASLNWLLAERPALRQVREALVAIANEGHRAAEVIQRIRQLARRAEPQRERLDVNGVIRDVVALVRSEALSRRVSLRAELASELPAAPSGRVQLPHGIVNAEINGK